MTLQTFLNNFQTNVNASLDFLKNKVTDPDVGLETRVETLEEKVLSKNDGLWDRVATLETALQHPSTGLITKVNDLIDGSVSQGAAGPGIGPAAAVSREKFIDLESRLAKTEFQSQVLLQWADNMYKDHKSLQKQVNFHVAKHHANELIIGGISEELNQDNKKATMKFFEEKLSLKVEPGELFYAKHIGKQGRIIQVEEEAEDGSLQVHKVQCPRHMIVKCPPQIRGKLLAKKKSLAGLIDPQGFKYFIAQYLPEPFKAAQNKYRDRVMDIVKQNSTKKPQDRTPVWVIGTELYINKKVECSIIHPPSPAEVCQNKLDYGPEMDSFELLSTRPKYKDGSTFQGFAVRVSKLLGVSVAYSKVRITAPKARHIKCAYHVAGVVIGKTLPSRKPSPLPEHKIFGCRYLIRRGVHRKMVITTVYLRVRCMSLT